MGLTTIVTKRWFGFYLLMFAVWYPTLFLLMTMFSLFGHPVFLLAGSVFSPLWILLVSYLYFKHARDDWSARFVTAIGWMVLSFLISAILVEPVYGQAWTSLFTWEVINANWVNWVAILVGGIAAHKTTTPNV